MDLTHLMISYGIVEVSSSQMADRNNPTLQFLNFQPPSVPNRKGLNIGFQKFVQSLQWLARN